MVTYVPACKFDTADIGFDVGGFDKNMLIDGEAFSIADVIATDGILGKTESFSITDGLLFILPFAEAFSIADVIITGGNLGKAEAFAITDGLLFILPLSEGFAIVDTVTFGLLLAETFTIADTKEFTIENKMIIRKLAIRFSAGNYVSDIELER